VRLTEQTKQMKTRQLPSLILGVLPASISGLLFRALIDEVK